MSCGVYNAICCITNTHRESSATFKISNRWRSSKLQGVFPTHPSIFIRAESPEQKLFVGEVQKELLLPPLEIISRSDPVAVFAKKKFSPNWVNNRFCISWQRPSRAKVRRASMGVDEPENFLAKTTHGQSK